MPNFQEAKIETVKKTKAYGAPREYQRGALYAAEEAVGALFRLPSKTHAESYMSHVYHNEKELFELRPVLRIKKANATFSSGGIIWKRNKKTLTMERLAVIELTHWGMNQWTVLHELAHVIVDSVYGREVPCHGSEYAGTLAYLVKKYIGEGYSEKLEAQFVAHGVTVS